jgi:D-threonate/D-erythronate kinase
MIAVIADDITGAAELGGLALSCGISCEVQTVFHHATDVDMIVVDSDSRSVDEPTAVSRVFSAATAIAAASPEWVYKKTDSAMRGHILAELAVVMASCGLPRCLFAPANPAIGRTIEDGRYLIRGTPLHQTDFAHDPEYPAVTSDVLALLLKGRPASLRAISPGDAIPADGVSVGQVRTAQDLALWARAITPDILPAGGGALFAAMLEARGFVRGTTPPPPVARTTLFICGSSTDVSHKALDEARAEGLDVHRMPGELFHGHARRDCVSRWAEDVITSLGTKGVAIAAIDRPAVKDSQLALRLRGHTADLAERILAACQVDSLIIEGGATAAAIMAKMGWTRFRPVAQLAHGVVQMSVVERPGLLVTVKPGSFAWPSDIWRTGR